LFKTWLKKTCFKPILNTNKTELNRLKSLLCCCTFTLDHWACALRSYIECKLRNYGNLDFLLFSRVISSVFPETEGFIFAIQDRVINTRNYKKHICGLQSIIDKCRICGTEGETIEHIISSCTVLAQSEYKKRHDIFAKIIHMNLAVKFNLLKNTQPHYSYTPESCLENDSYKLYFDRTILTDIHIKHNRPDIIILNKQQKQAYLLDIAVPNSHNITQTYNTKINKYLELSVAMRNLWCLEKISILPLVISATGIVPQSLFKNLKILDLDNTLVVEIQKGILLYSCHIVRKFLNIDTEHNTQQSQNAEARRR
jgi:hypothetical protein